MTFPPNMCSHLFDNEKLETLSSGSAVASKAKRPLGAPQADGGNESLGRG